MLCRLSSLLSSMDNDLRQTRIDITSANIHIPLQIPLCWKIWHFSITRYTNKKTPFNSELLIEPYEYKNASKQDLNTYVLLVI